MKTEEATTNYLEPDEDPGRMQINKLVLALTKDSPAELPADNSYFKCPSHP